MTTGAGVRAADEVVHALVDAEQLHEGVERAHGEEASEERRVHDPRHDEAAAIALDRPHDAIGRVVRVEDGKQPLEPRLHAAEHARRDVEGAHDGRADVASKALQLQAERFVEADRRVLAGAVVDEA